MAKKRGQIVVAAGNNGAGKSTIVEKFFLSSGQRYFNPDTFARRLAEQGKTIEEANAAAWQWGFNTLQRAIVRREDFAFETTLGGNSIVRALLYAIHEGLRVRMFYVGLASPELHIARVKTRVARGGHDIPVRKIRQRYLLSHANLLSLVGKAAEIRVFDNSTETVTGEPAPRLVLHMKGMRIFEPDRDTLLEQTPSWAKPIVAGALRTGLKAF